MQAFAKRGLTLPDPAQTLQPGASSPREDPSGGDTSRLGMTRYANARQSVCHFLPQLQSPFVTLLKSNTRGRQRRIDIQHSQLCLGACSTTNSGKGPATLSWRTKSALAPGPWEIRPEPAALFAPWYKMYLSGAFLFDTAGSGRVQDVTSAGAFLPCPWNTAGQRSASRSCPVGARLRLYHGVLVSLTDSDHNFEFLYRSRPSLKTSKFPCHVRRGLQGPTFSTLLSYPPTGRLDHGGNDAYS